MNNNILNILFLIDKIRINKKGKAPLRCRITYLGIRKIFATGVFIKPDNWNNEKQIAIPPDIENDNINNKISLISQKINQAFLILQVQNKNFDVDDIYLKYKGDNIKANKTLMELFEKHNISMKSLIGIDYANSTYRKFIEAKNHAKGFIKHQYNKRDIDLVDLNLKFLNEFDIYLKTIKKHKQITINKSIQRIRKIIKLALSEGFITTDPFLLYKPKRVENQVVFLDEEELEKLKEHEFSQKRLEQVKDLFIFCCYTGLAYEEMSCLKNKNIIKGFDGKKWINIYRKKTKRHLSIPLFLQAQVIIKKYSKDSSPDTLLLPKISNQKFNSYLKEIADILGIEKRLTHHTARKTFATTILLYNDIPIEIVSELLGHSKISTTQEHYAKVVQKKVSIEINKLSKKLNKK